MNTHLIRITSLLLALCLLTEFVPANDLQTALLRPGTSLAVTAPAFERQALGCAVVFGTLHVLLSGAIAARYPVLHTLLNGPALVFAAVPYFSGPLTDKWLAVRNHIQQKAFDIRKVDPELRIPADQLFIIWYNLRHLNTSFPNKVIQKVHIEEATQKLEAWVDENHFISWDALPEVFQDIILEAMRGDNSLISKEWLARWMNIISGVPLKALHKWGWTQLRALMAENEFHKYTYSEDAVKTELPKELQDLALLLHQLTIFLIRPIQARSQSIYVNHVVYAIQEWIRRRSFKWGKPPFMLLGDDALENLSFLIRSVEPENQDLGMTIAMLFDEVPPELIAGRSPPEPPELDLSWAISSFHSFASLNVLDEDELFYFQEHESFNPDELKAVKFLEAIQNNPKILGSLRSKAHPPIFEIVVVDDLRVMELAFNAEYGRMTIFIPLRRIRLMGDPEDKQEINLLLNQGIDKSIHYWENPPPLLPGGMWPWMMPVYDWVADHSEPFIGYAVIPTVIEGGLTLALDKVLLFLFNQPYAFDLHHFVSLSVSMFIWVVLHYIPPPAFFRHLLLRRDWKTARMTIDRGFFNLAVHPALTHIFGVTVFVSLFLWVFYPDAGFWFNMALPMALTHGIVNFAEVQKNPYTPRIKRREFPHYRDWQLVESYLNNEINLHGTGDLRIPATILKDTDALFESKEGYWNVLMLVENKTAMLHEIVKNLPGDINPAGHIPTFNDVDTMIWALDENPRDMYKTHAKSKLQDRAKELRRAAAKFKSLALQAERLRQWLEENSQSWGRIPWFVVPRSSKEAILQWLMHDFAGDLFRVYLPDIEETIAQFVNAIDGIPLTYLRPWGWRWVRQFLSSENRLDFRIIPLPLQILSLIISHLHSHIKEITSGERDIRDLHDDLKVMEAWGLSDGDAWGKPSWNILPLDLQTSIENLLTSDDLVTRSYGVRILRFMRDLPKDLADYVKSKDSGNRPFQGGPRALGHTLPTSAPRTKPMDGRQQRTRLEIAA